MDARRPEELSWEEGTASQKQRVYSRDMKYPYSKSTVVPFSSDAPAWDAPVLCKVSDPISPVHIPKPYPGPDQLELEVWGGGGGAQNLHF